MQLYLNDQILFFENTSTPWIRLNFSRIEKNQRFKIYRVDRSIKTDDIVDTDHNLGHSLIMYTTGWGKGGGGWVEGDFSWGREGKFDAMHNKFFLDFFFLFVMQCSSWQYT